jgi:hypothetical protein
MKLKHWLAGAACGLSLATFGTGAQAGPLGGIGNAAIASQATGDIESVRWVTRCHWHRGHRHCRRVWRDDGYYDDYGYYGRGYPYYQPYAYYGGPYAYGPGFGLYFGGGHRHYHRHHRHRHW